MRHFEIEDREDRKTFWIYPDLEGDYEPAKGELDPDRAAIQIRYLNPREQESLQRKMLASGILRKLIRNRTEIVETARGREADRDLAYATAFIAGWQHISIGGEDRPYSPQAAGEAISKSVLFNRVVGKAVEEAERFFSSNGSGS